MIYLDHNATTPIAPEVREAMLPFLGEKFANPSSPYTYAHDVAEAVARAREQVSRLCGCEPAEVLFTSGATESNLTALLGVREANPKKEGLVTSTVEHSSIRNTSRHMSEQGTPVSMINVDIKGQLNEAGYEDALTVDTGLVSIMAANNETGVLFPVERYAKMARDRDIVFHTDAVQLAGKTPILFNEWGLDLLSISAHKFHGPKGVGALCLRKGLSWPPLLRGGDQEGGHRAGTENVPGIVGMGCAAELAIRDIAFMQERVEPLREQLESGLLEKVEGCSIAARDVPRLSNTTAVLLDKIESEAVLALLDMEGICCSSGSACTSGSTEPSYVLKSMGLTTDETQAAIRFSLHTTTTEDEVERVIQVMSRMVERLRTQEKA
jgi:cysteine desulfurase